MNLACNIDQRGRRARLVGGVIVDTCGVALIVAGTLTGSTMVLVLGIFLSIVGAFMIFEGARGWCALRAMGIKTRL